MGEEQLLTSFDKSWNDIYPKNCKQYGFMFVLSAKHIVDGVKNCSFSV